MRRYDRRVALMLLVATLGPAMLLSCDNDDSSPVDAATIEALFLQKLDNIPGLGAALERTLTHLGGNPQPGVNIVPTATGGTGTVGVDQDGDGFQESTVTGTLTWNDPMLGLAGGAVLEITELTGNAVQMTASVTVSGPTQVLFGDIVANVPAEGSRPQVVVFQGEITVDVSTSPPGLAGFADFAVGDVSATMLLTEDGSGNLSIVVEGDDFTFTLP